jgi:DNA-binding FadR family transcriptional regulator
LSDVDPHEVPDLVAPDQPGARLERDHGVGERPRVEMVMEAILKLMREEGLKAGQTLPSEMALAARFHVSRPVVREALRSLTALSLIDLGTGHPARVRLPDGNVLGLIVEHAVRTEHVSIQQIYDARRTIEMRTVELAAMRRNAEEAAAISALVEAMYTDFDDLDGVMMHDIAFHQAIGEASRNPMFSLIVRSFDAVTRQTWRISWLARRTAAERVGTVDIHRKIAAAITDGDAAAAATAMAEHFDNSIKALVTAGLN